MNVKTVNQWIALMVSILIAIQVASAFAAAGDIGTGDVIDSVYNDEDLTQEDEIKTKTVYLHNETGTVNTIMDVNTMNTTMGVNQHITDWSNAASLSFNWYLNPPYAGDFILDGNVNLHIWMRQRDATGGTNFATLIMNLYEVSPGGDMINLGTYDRYYEDVRTTFSEYSVSGNYEHTVSEGHTLRIMLTIESNAQVGTSISYGDTEFPSRLELDTSTYLNTESLKVLDWEYIESYSFTLSGNTTIHFNTTVTNPFGGYDIWKVFIALEGPEGTVFEKVEMTRVSGNDTSYESNYTYSWNYGDAPEGDYIVTVSAVDMSGYHYRYPDNPDDETYGGHLESISRSFWIGEERYHVHFRTTDSLDHTMEDAVVSVYTTLGNHVTSNHTDENGITNVSVRGGAYTLRVYWQDMIVNETSYQVTDNVSYDEAVNLSCAVFNPIYRVVDVAGEPIRSANMFIIHPNGTVLRKITNSEGYANMGQMAGGHYTIRTEWLDREVNSTGHDLDSNDLFVINANIFYLDITTVDAEGDTVPDVQVSIRFNDTGRIADAKLTDINGEVTVRLPGTQQGFGYNMEFLWRGVNVASVDNYTLLDNRSLTVTLEIYYVNFQTVDHLGNALENTRIMIYNLETGNLANSGTTDQDGNITLILPNGLHKVIVSWRGIDVAEEIIDVPTIENVTVIECRVYYVEFHTVDELGLNLANTRITVSHINVGVLTSDTTDESGRITMRLPGETLDVDVVWRGVNVYSDSLVIDSSEYITLVCSVHYVDLHIVDDLTLDLENARIVVVNVETGELVNSGFSDMDGRITFRLPNGLHDVTVSWRGIDVAEETIDVPTIEDITVIECRVYHVEFHTVDELDFDLSNARITVSHVNVGVLTSGTTDENARITMRLPGETLDINVAWRGVNVYSDSLVIDSSEYIKLVCSVYYVDLHVVDDLTLDLENARIVAVNVETGELVNSGFSDMDGRITFRLPMGLHDVTVSWRGIDVAEETIDVPTTENVTVIECRVYHVEFHTVDELDFDLSNARITVSHVNVGVLTSSTTDESGRVTMRLPGETLDVDVVWRGVSVYTDSLVINSSEYIRLICSVYYVDLHVVDDLTLDLENARIVAVNVETGELVNSGYSNMNGRITFRLPNGLHDITVSWRGIDVAEETIDVPTIENITVIECRVYHVEFHTVDELDYDLANARIIVSHTDIGVLASGTTGENGRVTMRLPGETLYVDVVWRSVNVYSDSLIIHSSEYIRLVCGVYYVEMHTVDDLMQALENARAVVVNVQTGGLVNSGFTDMDGMITFRLPNGLHDVTVSWRGIDVAEETIDVPTNENITVIECRVYHVEFHTVDELDYDLANARITVSHTDVGVLASGTTGENGRVTMRLPGETFNVNVVWKDVNVYSESLIIDSSEYIPLVCSVYYVDMHVVDDLSMDLENARIVAVNVQTGELISSGYSDMNGEITFRLPNGLHDITVSWRGIDVAEVIIDIPTADGIVIECRVYHVEFHAVDGQDYDLANARITVSHTSAGVLTSGITDENGRITMLLPGETLDVDAAWRGVNVYSDSLVIDSSEYIKLVCSVYYVDLHVVDDLEMDLENAYIELYHRGEILYSVTTGYDGVATDVRLPGTNVDIHIYWKSIHLHSETIFVEQDSTETFSVPVYHVDFQVQDDLGEEISDGRLDVYHGSILMHTDITCMDGTSYARIPHATNRVTLNWKSVLVYDQELNFDSSGTLLIEVTDVYNVTLQSVDSRNITVESAVHRFYVNGYQFESGETDVNGTINLRVPTPVDAPGEIKIDIFWRGVQVYNQTITVDSHIFEDSPRLLDTEIYYVDYSIEDQKGVAVGNAKAIGTHSELPDDNNIIADQITDEEGYILFRLPRGYQQISVYWKDVLVGADSFELEDDIGIVVSSEVYYLTVTVTDDMNHPVESAHVRLTYADTPRLYEAGYTDTTGRVTIRIPVGSWDIEIHWLKTSVYEGNIQVDSNENSWSHDAAVDVYYLTVVTQDRKGEPLDDVHLKVSADDMMWTGYTEKGEYVFKLPARGDYELVASLRTTYLLSNVDLVESRQITLTEESSEPVNFEEYPIQIYRTNLFMMILLILVIMVVLVVVYSRLISSPGVDTMDDDTMDDDTMDDDTMDDDTMDDDTMDDDTMDDDTIDDDTMDDDTMDDDTMDDDTMDDDTIDDDTMDDDKI